MSVYIECTGCPNGTEFGWGHTPDEWECPECGTVNQA